MQSFDFNTGWLLLPPAGFVSFGSGGGVPVTLPHDATIHTPRSAESTNGAAGAWFNGGTYTYIRPLQAPPEWRGKTIKLAFEGVAQNAMVYVNGQFAGKCPGAYTGFTVDIGALLDFADDAENEIKVVAKTGMQKTARWYTGSGIYRPVHLLVGGEAYIQPGSVRITTRRLVQGGAVQGGSGQSGLPGMAQDGQNGQGECRTATVVVEAVLCHTAPGLLEAELRLVLRGPDGAVAAADSQPVSLVGSGDTTVCSSMDVAYPALWSVDSPSLYTCEAVLLCGGSEAEAQCTAFGIRTIEVSRTNGLCINGQQTKLRGGCIHHDNGLLGAADYYDAELRRVQRLKDAGFNAIRSAHNPASHALLDACDRVGMLVMDELFDVWNTSKADHDYALSFNEWWRQDMQAAVAKNYNHPSVILYTIGNEIPDTGTKAGAALNRTLAAALRALDGTRPVANCINGMFSAMGNMAAVLKDILGGIPEGMDSDINAMMSALDANLDAVMRHPVVTGATEETFAGVDVCGYNYMHSRYESDGDSYPNRIIVGSETNPDKIGYAWPVILRHPYLLGDFVWTAWDYIGEAGVGKNDYELTHSMYGHWPWYLAFCGDFDLCGNRRPQSFYREVVWGLRKAPYLAVERPQYYNVPKHTTNWTWPDVIESWTWPGFEGKPVHAEVYTDADEVELLLNGEAVAKAAVGAQMPCKALFDIAYQPGTLVAVAYRNGAETGRMALATAGRQAAVQVCAGRQALVLEENRPRLAYLDIALVDENGCLNASEDREIGIEIEGPAVLAGFGSADPRSTLAVDGHTTKTFDGRAQAVLLATGKAGRVEVTIKAAGLTAGRATIEIQ